MQNGKGSPWRTIDSGIRMSNSWPDAFFSFLLSPSFTDDDVAAFSYFALMHGRYLRSFPTAGNWVTMEMCGLFTTGCIFPEMKEAANWRAFAAKRMRDEETTQFLPDGAQYELSPGYHNTALDNLKGIVRVAKLTGRLNELPSGYIAGMERAFDYDLFLMTPNRSLPKFNDSGWDVGVRSTLRDALQFFPDRTDYRWIWTQGKEGAPPSVTSHTIEDAQTSAVTTQDKGLPNLALIPLQTSGLAVRVVSAQTTPEILGWYVFKDHVPAEVPATTVLHTIAGTGVQTLVTLLVPLEPGAGSPVTGIQQPAPDAWNIRFNNGRQLAIAVDANAGGGIQPNETLPDGKPGRHIAIDPAPPAKASTTSAPAD
jgi:hypothetical protein